MDLEEHSTETASTRCEECGAKLTDEEIAAALESGGPVLCSIHAVEAASADDEDEAAASE